MTSARSKTGAREKLAKCGLRPRLLGLDLAAAYVGLSTGAFLKGVAAGLYPQPITNGRRKQWDIRAINQAIDHRSGLASSSDTDEYDAIMRAIDAA